MICLLYTSGSRQQGSNADYVVIPEQNAIPFDPSISYEQGAMFEPSTVALHGLLQNDYQGGRCVAILGCGTIGIFTIDVYKRQPSESAEQEASSENVESTDKGMNSVIWILVVVIIIGIAVVIWLLKKKGKNSES